LSCTHVPAPPRPALGHSSPQVFLAAKIYLARSQTERPMHSTNEFRDLFRFTAPPCGWNAKTPPKRRYGVRHASRFTYASTNGLSLLLSRRYWLCLMITVRGFLEFCGQLRAASRSTRWCRYFLPMKLLGLRPPSRCRARPAHTALQPGADLHQISTPDCRRSAICTRSATPVSLPRSHAAEPPTSFPIPTVITRRTRSRREELFVCQPPAAVARVVSPALSFHLANTLESLGPSTTVTLIEIRRCRCSIVGPQ